MDMLATEEAIDLIRRSGRSGQTVLGLDGFQLVPEGYIARLDLILDLHTEKRDDSGRRPMVLAAEAEKFISERAALDIVWELVIAD